MHLVLPVELILHHRHRFGAEMVIVHELLDGLLVGAHPAADERNAAGAHEVAPLHAARFLDLLHDVYAQLVLNLLADLHFLLALAGAHASKDYALLRRYALVTGELKVGERLGLLAGIEASVAIDSADGDFGAVEHDVDQNERMQFGELLLSLLAAHFAVFAPHDGDELLGQVAQVLEVLAFIDFAVDHRALHHHVAHSEYHRTQTLHLPDEPLVFLHRVLDVAVVAE
mmetsp:Transcript_61120/g.132514  ORF Transcript_61120/g.132514 Transcript_61120/m.132514 type:complete len:228 (+) Transcript_61120:665-1348(+)